MENPALVEEIFKQAVILAPEVLSAGEETKSSTEYFKVSGYLIPLNNGFRNLMRGWVRLYRKHIEEYCPCDISEEKIIRQTEESIAKGFFSVKVGEPVTHIGEHVALSLYGYSARYGKVIALIKASAEAVEHSLPIPSFLCHAIDVMIFFILRKTQNFIRVFSGAHKNMQKNKMSSFVLAFRSAFISRVIKKAQNKVFFHLETANINSIALAEVDQEGTRKNKRDRFVHLMSKQTAPLIANIKTIDSTLEQESLSEKEKIKLLKKRRKLYRKMEKITQIHRKDFLGKRYMWSAFLVSRKFKRNYLKGQSFLDSLSAGPGLWPLSVQENILERAFIKPVNQNMALNQAGFNIESKAEQRGSQSHPKADGVRAGLAQEFVQKVNPTGFVQGAAFEVLDKQTQYDEARHTQSVEKKLMDIDNIFNVDRKTKERYFLANELELELTGFFEYYLKRVYRQIIQSKDLSFRERAKLRWRIEKFAYYVFAYTDFLRMVSMVKDKRQLFLYKHKAMENYLIFYEYLSAVSRISSSSITKQDIDLIMEKHHQKILSFQIQREKRVAFSWFSWLPFYTPLPHCRNLVRII